MFAKVYGNMKVCLLTCPAPFLIDEKVFPPLGLITVGTALRNQGHDVRITSSPDDSSYFGLGPTTPEYADAVKMLHQIKSRNESSRVVVGGPHAIANSEKCLTDGFDAVVIGDGENITAETFEANGTVNLGRRPLDEYPVANRSLVDIHDYQYRIADEKATTLMTSRGCPYRCAFCAKPENKVRYYSVARVEQEVACLRDQWNFRGLMIFDDTFILNGERARKICSVLWRYDLVWRCFVRGDLVVRHGVRLTAAMAESGCVEVAIGIESGSDRILRIIRKGETSSAIRKAISMLRQVGIRVKGLFIIGLPGEDRNSLAETRRFLEEAQLDDADFTIYQPYRGSPIWNNRQDYDVDWDDVPLAQRFYKGRLGEYKCAVYTSSLTQNDLVEARDNLEKLFRSSQV